LGGGRHGSLYNKQLRRILHDLIPTNRCEAFDLAIVGRPNVGKSTLFNRLTGSRRAIVGDEPGITRDRLYAEAEWRGRPFRIVDTGGIIPDDEAFIPSEIFRQAKVALDEAAAVVMVVDGRTELAAPDIELARLLNRTGKPVFLAVNKIDTAKQQSLLGEFHRLGLKNVLPISAENGNGLDDLLDGCLRRYLSKGRSWKKVFPKMRMLPRRKSKSQSLDILMLGSRHC